MIRIARELYPIVAILFIDDIGVKGPYITYDNKETIPGVRRYIFEYIQNLDKTIDWIKRAGAYIRAKS